MDYTPWYVKQICIYLRITQRIVTTISCDNLGTWKSGTSAGVMSISFPGGVEKVKF